LTDHSDPLSDRGIPEATILAERQIEAINRFPDQNPHPVMRMTDDGLLVYANVASEPIMSALGIQVGEELPPATLDAIRVACVPGRPAMEIRTAGHRTYSILAVPVEELGFINLYGTDITVAKGIDRFPGSNPNPVIRMSPTGALIYANDASEPLRQALGASVGEQLPADLVSRLLAAADGRSDEPIELRSAGHTYQLTPVHIPEFGFLNIYGTDVTALKAIDKFPDVNPNPVMRVSHEGVLLYANPASTAIREVLRVVVGDVLPSGVLSQILERVGTGSREPLELETADGRLFAVVVAAIYEFDFINLYGTDVTAARAIERANAENERLLLNILPEPIAARLRAGERLIADRFESATLLFADIVGFTSLSARMTPHEVVQILNEVFSMFDDLVDRYHLEKIKTIGDAYMVVGGLPDEAPGHCARVAAMALDLCAAVARRNWPDITFRVGMDTGPVVAGVIGSKKFIYDVWGNTVNTASRMESHGVPGRVQVTEAVFETLRDTHDFEPRGVIDVRGRGPMPAWLLLGPKVRDLDRIEVAPVKVETWVPTSR
jgi:class 3 adenylate cyclase